MATTYDRYKRIREWLSPNDDYVSINETMILEIDKYLKENNLTKKEFAEKIGVTPMTLSRIINRKTKILRPKTYRAIYDILNIENKEFQATKRLFDLFSLKKTIDKLYYVSDIDGYTDSERLNVIKIILCREKNIENSYRPTQHEVSLMLDVEHFISLDIMDSDADLDKMLDDYKKRNGKNFEV